MKHIERLNFDNIIKKIISMTQTIALVDDDRNILTSISTLWKEKVLKFRLISMESLP